MLYLPLFFIYRLKYRWLRHILALIWVEVLRDFSPLILSII